MISGRPSATALLVALSVLRRGAQYDLPEQARALAKEALHAAGGGWRWLGRVANHSCGRVALAALEGLSFPGLAQHHCRRKRWLLDRLSRQPTPRRWLWLGVGYDGTGLALRQSGVSRELLEWDHPDSLHLRHSLPVWRRHRHSLAQSAALPLPQEADRLVALCAQAPCSLIAEGLLMYLPPRHLVRLLRGLAALPTPPRLLFSALDARDGPGFGDSRRGWRRWLARRNESFRWRLPPSAMAQLLARHGYRIDALWCGHLGEYAIDAGHSTEPVAIRSTPACLPMTGAR